MPDATISRLSSRPSTEQTPSSRPCWSRSAARQVTGLPPISRVKVRRDSSPHGQLAPPRVHACRPSGASMPTNRTSSLPRWKLSPSTSLGWPETPSAGTSPPPDRCGRCCSHCSPASARMRTSVANHRLFRSVLRHCRICISIQFVNVLFPIDNVELDNSLHNPEHDCAAVQRSSLN
jgi:hypothetical protein